MYYKFRDLKNYKYILDIFLNQRLYSSSFRNLNDNFEGQFFSDNFEESKRVRLNPNKEKHLSVCSFSEDYKSHLMWSHYANGHRGIAIGFEIDKSEYIIDKVEYNGLASFKNLPLKADEIKSVFLNKLSEWKYEEEYRIITEKQDYISIKIKKVIFGAETQNYDKEVISKLVELVDNRIIIETYND
ncbi:MULTISPECIES: DUF2971 domain-containing protein [Bizionia]|uniref:DUF2971 domain-containing protein n=1 Tax=Bizionia algoritergicola TaxID=291187 RepID=A0A5D0R133_9FLAO|nr:MULTISPECIES: DUF2971 domain-containing protein [Bizionia]OBX24299.1 hypothetical protein BAA08_00445 [Bizionia sp. APA-3]TYB75222.1 DUF2971 domain-containing protein [Bizionia algoritergicola]